eukprot:gene15826-20968_t
MKNNGMEPSYTVAAGPVSLVFNGILFAARLLGADADGGRREIAAVSGAGTEFLLSRDTVGGAEVWSGLCGREESRAFGAALEEAGIIPAANPDPFGDSDRNIPVSHFFIDGMKVEKVVPGGPFGLTYYRLHIEDGWLPVIACARFPESGTPKFYPVSPLSKYDLTNMTEMVWEYEDGTY